MLMFSPYTILKELVWTINTISFSFTATTMISLPILYFLILYVFKKSRRRVNDTAHSTMQQESNNQSTKRISKKLVQRSLWLIGAYLACTSLAIISYTLYSAGVIKHGYFYQVTNVFFLGSSCANPCIYMYKDKKFRKIAIKLLQTSQGTSDWEN